LLFSDRFCPVVEGTINHGVKGLANICVIVEIGGFVGGF
jgi:hypothetical protein